MTFTSQGIGSCPASVGEYSRREPLLDVIHVPSAGLPRQFDAVVSGNVDYVIGDVTAVPLVKGRLLKALAVTSPERSAILPHVPTFAEGGVTASKTRTSAPSIASWNAARHTRFLNRSIVQALGDAEVEQRFARLGFAAASSSRAQLATRIESDFEKFGKIIHQAGSSRTEPSRKSMAGCRGRVGRRLETRSSG